MEAGRSKKSADHVTKVKQELINYRSAPELAERKPVLMDAREAMDKADYPTLLVNPNVFAWWFYKE